MNAGAAGRLISVLFSSRPLTAAVAMDLYQLAHRLYHGGEATGQMKGELIQGTVTNLKKDVLIGTLGGPVFEAALDTEVGHTEVRFLLTRAGVELLPAQVPSGQLN